MQFPICLYNKTLLNCFPGNCRMMPFISRSKSVARTSEEFKPERSTISSMCTGSSALSSSRSFFSEPFSAAAANQFRCSPSGRSACRRAARMSVGSSSITSSAQVASFAPCLMSWCVAKLTGCVAFPGTPNTSLPNSMAKRAVIRDPLYCAPSTSATPSGMPATMRFRTGKFSGAGCVPQRKFADARAALQHFLVRLFVFLWEQTSMPVPSTPIARPLASIAP